MEQAQQLVDALLKLDGDIEPMLALSADDAQVSNVASPTSSPASTAPAPSGPSTRPPWGR